MASLPSPAPSAGRWEWIVRNGSPVDTGAMVRHAVPDTIWLIRAVWNADHVTYFSGKMLVDERGVFSFGESEWPGLTATVRPEKKTPVSLTRGLFRFHVGATPFDVMDAFAIPEASIAYVYIRDRTSLSDEALRVMGPKPEDRLLLVGRWNPAAGGRLETGLEMRGVSYGHRGRPEEGRWIVDGAYTFALRPSPAVEDAEQASIFEALAIHAPPTPLMPEEFREFPVEKPYRTKDRAPVVAYQRKRFWRTAYGAWILSEPVVILLRGPHTLHEPQFAKILSQSATDFQVEAWLLRGEMGPEPPLPSPGVLQPKVLFPEDEPEDPHPAPNVEPVDPAFLPVAKKPFPVPGPTMEPFQDPLPPPEPTANEVVDAFSRTFEADGVIAAWKRNKARVETPSVSIWKRRDSQDFIDDLGRGVDRVLDVGTPVTVTERYVKTRNVKRLFVDWIALKSREATMKLIPDAPGLREFSRDLSKIELMLKRDVRPRKVSPWT